MTEPKLDHSTRVCVCVRMCPKHARSHRIKRNRPNVFQGSLPKFISRICGATSNTHTLTQRQRAGKKQQQEAKEFFAQPCVSTTTNHRRAAPTFNTTQNDHASSSSKHAAAFVRGGGQHVRRIAIWTALCECVWRRAGAIFGSTDRQTNTRRAESWSWS